MSKAAREINTTTRKLKLAPKPSLLPPENEIEIAPEGTSGETLNQKLLRELHELQEQRDEINRRFAIKYAQIQELIIHGAEIKSGTYKVAYAVRLHRRPRYKQALIDAKGEEYQQRILNGTQPHAHFRVRVS